VRGLRVHLAGSASAECDGELLASSHAFIRALTSEIVSRGGGLVLGAGQEPRGNAGEPCVFDWSALEVIAALPEPASEWPALQPQRFVVASTQAGLAKIPADRRNVWDSFRARSDIDTDVAPSGWRMAGVIREMQVRRGDILVVLGGGAGVEHLAQLYAADGKPVIPIKSEIGSYSKDGSGGSSFLHDRAVDDTRSFFRLKDGMGSATAKLLSLRLEAGTDGPALAKEFADLLSDLRSPSAFYVRLQDAKDPDYSDVEHYFRTVVDPVIIEKQFSPDEIGRRRPQAAFMNVDIFRSVHAAGLVVVDLTGVRPNCMMELGYALARKRRVIVTAKEGTQLPFDSDKLPTHMWDPSTDDVDGIAALSQWFDLHSELSPLFD
jgi:hypothetical protein